VLLPKDGGRSRRRYTAQNSSTKVLSRQMEALFLRVCHIYLLQNHHQTQRRLFLCQLRVAVHGKPAPEIKPHSKVLKTESTKTFPMVFPEWSRDGNCGYGSSLISSWFYHISSIISYSRHDGATPHSLALYIIFPCTIQLCQLHSLGSFKCWRFSATIIHFLTGGDGSLYKVKKEYFGISLETSLVMGTITNKIIVTWHSVKFKMITYFYCVRDLRVSLFYLHQTIYCTRVPIPMVSMKKVAILIDQILSMFSHMEQVSETNNAFTLHSTRPSTIFSCLKSADSLFGAPLSE
jgi:hypothetical protein